MSTLKVNEIQNASGVTQYLAKAWVNFNGTGTVAIRASGNVSSITDSGVGLYTVNFTTAMPDANYVVHSAVEYGTAARPNFSSFTASSLATGSVGITTGIMASSTNNGALADYTEVCVVIFR